MFRSCLGKMNKLGILDEQKMKKRMIDDDKPPKKIHFLQNSLN
jgi:hypothetical protein